MGNFKFWQNMTGTDFEGLDPSKCVVMVTSSPMEIHGPHLPVGTDTFEAPTATVSFRISPADILDIDILMKHLGYSSRSKFLSELVPAAIADAVSKLPEDMIEEVGIEISLRKRVLQKHLAKEDIQE